MTVAQWLTLLQNLLPALFQAAEAIANGNGTTVDDPLVTQKLVQHLTPGQPNAPELSEEATPPST
jgi:hypothetical protein